MCNILTSTTSLVSFVVVDMCQIMEKEIKSREPASLLKSKKKFSVASPCPARPSFKAAREKNFEKSRARRSGRDRRNVSVTQRDIKNIFLVDILIDFEIVVNFSTNLMVVTVLLM